MRIPVLAALSAFTLASLGGCATATDELREARTEVGYKRGELALAAIRDGDWQAAEARLAADANDPAQVLNLAHVYRRTGREAEARFLYARVLEMRDADDLMVDGRRASSRQLARTALAAGQLASR